jgi:hypothetical protein
MNPQLLQMLLPYLMQLFQGQGGGANSLMSLFGQNGQNSFMQPQQQQQAPEASNMLQPVSGGVQAPSGVVGGQTPVNGQTGSAPGASVPSPQNGISPTGAPQSMNGIWTSLLAGLQNNALQAPQSAPGNSFFGG